MRIPDHLAEKGKKRIASFPVDGFVFGGGPEHPKMMLVGEAPGETEIGNGVPFSGRAGRELMTFIERLGLTREEVYITSAVRSRPYRWGEKKTRDGQVVKRKYNRPPTAREITAHAPLLDYEVANVRAPVIVTLGNIGLKRLAGPDKKIGDCHGDLLVQPVQKLDENDQFVWTDKEYRIFPTYHPASIFYNRSLLEVIHSDLEKLKEVLASG
ncbi:uracil-DNA glycosylase [Alteribacter keqinensis]|uniref:Uracil-DNA glycosylase n=1 Tax=Alteribacter keqinensis TaxID=2483800 RepID=A0A3M7TL53_9BACI|nr:uracil-DNA glycosylase [Alteribacter keqinensis]RNA66267.1 uracil-DNA glycosylase [Alteribacter keqinensis]